MVDNIHGYFKKSVDINIHGYFLVLIRVGRLRFFRPWSVAVLVGFGISVIGFGFSKIFG
jgi:hypothetical protein